MSDSKLNSPVCTEMDHPVWCRNINQSNLIKGGKERECKAYGVKTWKIEETEENPVCRIIWKKVVVLLCYQE